jgi:hypothetical protein
LGFTVPATVASPPPTAVAARVATVGEEVAVEVNAMVNVRFQVLFPVV